MFYTKKNNSLPNVILVIICCFLGISNAYSQFGDDIFDLRLQAEVDCERNVLTTILQIRAQSDTFKIGTSSILLKYDGSVLDFSSYQSINFDASSPCFPGDIGGAWSAHAFDGTVDGFFNLTLNLNAEPFSCPVVDTQWIDIGAISFEVTNINAFPNFQFDLGNSTFNRSNPNNGEFAPEQGDLMPYNVLLVTACACEPPTLRDDTLDAGCPALFYEANIFNNDIVSNPTVSINTNPTKGTAIINPNGIFNYVPSTLYCGEDQFTYLVCNDGKEECCSEATVIIRFSDETPPFFLLNIPRDTTVTCDQIPVIGLVSAADNCPEVSLVFTENRDEGNCRNNAIIVRTWTATDICGNSAVVSQVITIIDTLPPVFSAIPPDMTVSCDSIPQAAILTATDNCEENSIVNFLEISSENECGFTLVRTWKSVDSCGNESVVNQKVTVIDEVAPRIECPADETVICSDINSTEIGEGRPIITDNCDESENILLTFTDEAIPQDCENKIFKQIRRVWKATDRCGNFDTCVQIIKIIDDIPPVIDCPTDFTINCGQSIDPEINESIAFASDNCSSVIINYEDAEIAPTDCNFNNKMIFRTWIAADECGNIDTCVQKITIIGEPCPDIITLDSVINICSGIELNLRNYFDLPEDTDYEGFSKDVNDFPDIYTVQAGCEIVHDEGILTIKNAEGCVVRIIHIFINIYPAIVGTIIYPDSGFCKVALLMECADFFQIDWKDDKGHTGVGTDYMGATRESGFVTFYVHLIDSTLLGLPCAIDSFSADYSCPEECPPTIRRDLSLTTCAGKILNLYESLDLDATRPYFFEGDVVISTSGIYEVGNPFGCEIGTKFIKIKVFDEHQCLIEEIGVSVTILPAISGNIVYRPDSSFCNPTLLLDCPEFYKVTWKDDNGHIGMGTTYHGAAGESGFVTFYMHSIDSTLLDLPCRIDSYFADYSCPEECPPGIQETIMITGCEGDFINLRNRLQLSATDRIKSDVVQLADLEALELIPEGDGCGVREQSFIITIFDENDCPIREVAVLLIIVPSIKAVIIHEDGFCRAKLDLVCPEKYQVTWEDNAGNTGEGMLYEGAAGGKRVCPVFCRMYGGIYIGIGGFELPFCHF